MAAPNVTLDLDGHTIYYGSDNGTVTNLYGQDGRHGVVFYLSWANTDIGIPGATTPDNVVIKNGRIIDEGTGVLAHAIYGNSANAFLIQNIRAEAGGAFSYRTRGIA